MRNFIYDTENETLVQDADGDAHTYGSFDVASNAVQELAARSDRDISEFVVLSDGGGAYGWKVSGRLQDGDLNYVEFERPHTTAEAEAMAAEAA